MNMQVTFVPLLMPHWRLFVLLNIELYTMHNSHIILIE